MKHQLEIDSIQLFINEKQLLSDIYLKCETGNITGLLGRNGQGKSCLMEVIYGSLTATNQSIRFDNIPIYQAFKRADLLTYLPQFNFIPQSLSINRVCLDFNSTFEELEHHFSEFSGLKSLKIKKLSGGQKRLLEVYLLIKSKAQFTMLDEPFSHIMHLNVEKIQALLIAEKPNKGFLTQTICTLLA